MKSRIFLASLVIAIVHCTGGSPPPVNDAEVDTSDVSTYIARGCVRRRVTGQQ